MVRKYNPRTRNNKTSPLDTRPRSVAIVGLGPSSQVYFAARSGKRGYLNVDETWVVNSAIQTLTHHKGFVMDDLQKVLSKYPEWGTYLKTVKTPIITCKRYPEWPASVEYPLDEVIDCVKDDLFTNTVAYMVGYAIYTKVKELYMYGCDFWYQHSQAIEAGMSNVGYLLGIAKERGVHFKIPQESTLLDAHLTAHMQDRGDGQVYRPLYGYDYNPGDAAEADRKGQATELEKKVAKKNPIAVGTKPNGEDKKKTFSRKKSLMKVQEDAVHA